MTERTQRRAAERKSRKAEEKKLRHQQQNAILKSTATAVATTSVATAAAATAPAAQPISEAQLAANRANAQLSQGPVTELGKSISSRNNLRHGLTQSQGDPILLDGESKADYADLLAGYNQEWQPTTSTEQDLVNRLVTHSWLRRRSLNLQKLFLRPEDGLVTDEKQFNLYRRYEIQHEQAFNKALSDLMRLRSLRIREQNGFESQRRQDEKHEYQIRCLKNRESLQKIAIMNAESRLTLAQGKLLNAGLLDTRPEGLVELSESYEQKTR